MPSKSARASDWLPPTVEDIIAARLRVDRGRLAKALGQSLPGFDELPNARKVETAGAILHALADAGAWLESAQGMPRVKDSRKNVAAFKKALETARSAYRALDLAPRTNLADIAGGVERLSAYLR
jgi:hypothetical protein